MIPLDESTASDIIEPPATSEESKRNKKIHCEFCESHISQNGEVLHLSDKAKAFRELEKTKVELEGRLTSKQQEIEELKNKLLALAPPAKTKKSLFK